MAEHDWVACAASSDRDLEDVVLGVVTDRLKRQPLDVRLDAQLVAHDLDRDQLSIGAAGDRVEVLDPLLSCQFLGCRAHVDSCLLGCSDLLSASSTAIGPCRSDSPS